MCALCMLIYGLHSIYDIHVLHSDCRPAVHNQMRHPNVALIYSKAL